VSRVPQRGPIWRRRLLKALPLALLGIACASLIVAVALGRGRSEGPHVHGSNGASAQHAAGAGDPDHDGLSNRQERRLHTNPHRRDTDGDHVPDNFEVALHSNPRDPRRVPRAPGRAPLGPAHCSRNATPQDFGRQVSATPRGATLCLVSGNYGTWHGTSRPITVRPAAGASATMGVEFETGDSGFTLEGMTIPGGRITDGAHNITIRDSSFTDSLFIDGLANAHVLLDHNSHVGINSCSACDPAMIHLAYNSTTPSGVTIAHSLFADGNADGVQTGVGVNIVGNEFRNITEGSCSSCHTDPIQLIDAPGAVVRGNYIHNTADGIVAYDGLRNAKIEDNVVDLVSGRWGIELYSDRNSVVRRNTLVYGRGCAYAPCGWIMLDRKIQDPAGRGTVIVGNIATAISFADGSTAARQDDNLVRRGGHRGDRHGRPTFIGGAHPSTWWGFALANRSRGRFAASDGGDVGIGTQ
jgi:Right handed beta helix region/Bacterial TSP3 repeat